MTERTRLISFIDGAFFLDRARKSVIRELVESGGVGEGYRIATTEWAVCIVDYTRNVD